MRRALLVALTLATSACATRQTLPADQPSAAVIAELDAANTAFSTAWIAADVDALLNAYTQDAILHPPAGGVLTSREAIRGVWAGITDQQRVGHRLEPTLRRVIGENLVLEMGRWHASRTVDGQSPWTSGCYTVVWRREADAWRMQYDGWTGVNDASWACRPR